MDDTGAADLTRRIEHLLELRLMGMFTSDDAAELSELYLLERSWRRPEVLRRAFERGEGERAHILDPAGRFQRPVARPPRDGGTPDRRCRLCGVSERDTHLMRLEGSTPTTRREQLVCDGCIRALEVTHDARRVQPRRGESLG